jgi:endogenous inhibitor of DNA gyrase (YacG/DUF329 family)
MMKCPNCGDEVEADTAFCPHGCGPLDIDESAAPDISGDNRPPEEVTDQVEESVIIESLGPKCPVMINGEKVREKELVPLTRISHQSGFEQVQGARFEAVSRYCEALATK